MADTVLPELLLKESKIFFVLKQALGEFRTIVGLDTFYLEGSSLEEHIEEACRGVGVVLIESLNDDEKNVYITLSYVDDNDMNKVTGITATDGNGDVLLDMNFVIPVDLERPILDEIQEGM